MIGLNEIFNGDCLVGLNEIKEKSVNCCVTSPPYWGLRDYGVDGQLGLEKTPEEYVNNLVNICRGIKRVLKDDGTLWLNLGDSYLGGKGKSGQAWSTNNQNRKTINKKQHQISGIGETRPSDNKHKYIKPKDLVGIPWMVAFALRADGWYLRQDIIWNKPNPMPESITDRCTKSHEYIFLLSKSQKYYFDYESIQEEATGYDGRKDTMMKGSIKYSDVEIMPGAKEQSMAQRGHERRQFKTKSTFGNRNGELDKLHSGKPYTQKFKNLQDKGQTNHSMHERRAEGLEDELYPVRNKRSVWTVNLKPFNEAHFATYPEKLIVDCIKAGCPENGIVLDPFMGSGTTAIVARKLNRNYIGIELNKEYIEIANKRIYNELGLFK